MTIHYADESVTVHAGDCLEVLTTLADSSVDSVVTDPPYGIRFMGKSWDGADITARTRRGRDTNPMPPEVGGPQGGYRSAAAEAGRYDLSENAAFGQWCELWARECLRVLKPGGHIAAFGGPRTWHRLAAAIEDAGFEIRDSIAWLYGSGFPKSLDVSKAIDRAAGAEREVLSTIPDRWAGKGSVLQRSTQAEADSVDITAPATDLAKQWQGWGTALKPAFEPIVVGRKPLRGTVAANVVEHGTGALNIDGCRVATTSESLGGGANKGTTGHTRSDGWARPWMDDESARDAAAARSRENTTRAELLGRWPANVVIDEHTAVGIDRDSGVSRDGIAVQRHGGGQRIFNHGDGLARPDAGYGGEGGASRFFPTFKYSAKAPTSQRPTDNGVAHPTVKPLDLMRWLVRLVTPQHGLVLDPFAGSGTTAEACVHEHMRCITIEREAEYLPLIVARLTKPMAVGFDFTEDAS